MKETPRPLYAVIAGALNALKNNIHNGNEEWEKRHRDILFNAGKHLLPSGSGIDAGTTVRIPGATEVWDLSEFTLNTQFHHMDDNGMYDGWTSHAIRVRPDWHGIDLRIGGQNRNGIKDYLHEVFDHSLSQMVIWDKASEEYVPYDVVNFEPRVELVRSGNMLILRGPMSHIQIDHDDEMRIKAIATGKIPGVVNFSTDVVMEGHNDTAKV